MLAGVNEDGLDLGLPPHLADERGDLGEIRTRADNIHDSEGMAHALLWVSTGDVV